MVHASLEHECALSHVLELSDGQAWNLRASDGACSWLQEFARILRLPEGFQKGIPSITFVRGASGGNWFGEPAGPSETHRLSRLLQGEWSERDLTTMKLWSGHHTTDRVCELLNTTRRSLHILMMSQSLHPIFDAAMDRGGIPLHAALVEHEGRGVLLAGAGGSGKSTCCRRLLSPWNVLCDDETLVLRGRGNRYTAHPLPTWNDFLVRKLDNTWNVQRHVPLHAIVYVVQSESESIAPIGRAEAATRICQSSEQACLRQMQGLSELLLRTWRKRMFENACDVSSAAPAFVLRVSLFGEFWRRIEDVLGSLAP
jgi:SynChlorMet cassette protein ScmC